MRSFDGLKVFMCGTSSPLPAPGRAQACVAILAGEILYIVDAGAGSAQVATPVIVPLENLQAIFLTHFHSDHIAALPEFEGTRLSFTGPKESTGSLAASMKPTRWMVDTGSAITVQICCRPNLGA